MRSKVAKLLSTILFFGFMAVKGVWAANYTVTIDTLGSVGGLEGSTLTFTVKIDQLPTNGDIVSVDYDVLDSTALVSDNDYTPTSGTLTFDGTSPTTQTFNVSTTGDTGVEADEKFVVDYTESITTSVASTVSLPVSSTNGTILNDDHEVTAFADISVNENVGNALLTVQLNSTVAAGNSVDFSVSHTPNTATAGGTDYTAPTATLIISSGNDSGTVSIPINNDSLVEDIEDFSISISPTSGNVTFPTIDGDATVTILKDEMYTISISPDFSVDVDAGVANVEVFLIPLKQPGDVVQLNYTTTDGSAANPNDYATQSGVLEFSDSNSTNPKTIAVPIFNDGVQSGPETFTVDLSNIVGVATFGDSSCTVTINDHDFEVVSFADQSMDEDSGSIVFDVVLDRDPIGSEFITFDYATSDGTATAPGDYISVSGTLTIDATDTTNDKKITVALVDDAVQESPEQFQVTLSNPSTNTLLTDNSASGGIFDDDYTVTSFGDISVNENVGTAQVTVQLNKNVVSGDSVSFNVSHTPGTAQDGSVDYTAPATTLTIGAGASSATVDIPINNDSLVEFAEEFVVSIVPSSINVTAPDPDATVTIVVDEKYSFSINDLTEVEADTTMDFTVTLVNPTPLQTEHNGLQLEVNTNDDSAVAPADYNAISGGTISFTDAANTRVVSVTIKADALSEGAVERYFVNLSANSPWADIVSFTDPIGEGEIQDTDYIITPSWNLHGNISLETPIGTPKSISNGVAAVVDNGIAARFTVTANYNIQSVAINGGAVPAYVTEVITDSKNRTYTFETTTPKGAYTINAVFDHQIDMIADGPGTVEHTTGTGTSVNNGGPVGVLAENGANETFLFTADSGSCVSEVVVDGSSMGTYQSPNNNWSGDSYTFNSVIDDHTIEAKFTDANITVNLGALDGKTGSDGDLYIQNSAGSGSGWRAYAADASYNKGALIKSGGHGDSINIPADTGCDTQFIVVEFLHVDGWLKPNDLNINLNGNFTNQIVEGLYDKDSFVLTIISSNGYVDLDPVGTAAVGVQKYIYPAGTSVELIPVANASWFFQAWQGDATGNSDPLTLVMDWDKTVTAVFAQGCQDADKDGYTTADTLGIGCTPSADIDCNDGDENIYPGATEICEDGIDQDCSGADEVCTGNDKDDDGDGFTENQGDCNDSDTSIYPGAYDDPATAVDEDCFDNAKEQGVEVLCSQPSDVPTGSALKPAPPMVMFLLDDSGSMDWEFMTDENNQLFSFRFFLHTYDDHARVYGNSSLTNAQRRQWPSQFSGYNRLYFNPKVTYNPWVKWQDVAAAATYPGNERGLVQPTEINYNTNNATFPDIAFVDGYVHADMDEPRLNTVDSNRGHSWSYRSTSNRNMRFDMNATFLTVMASGEGQQIVVTRDGSSNGADTGSDAIGLSTSPSLELTDGHQWTWYDGSPGRIAPEIIFDDHRADWGDVYSESGSWTNSGGSSAYEWQTQTRYTQNLGGLASTRLNLTAPEAGNYYVYAWMDDTNDRDHNARYDIFYYDGGGNLLSDTLRIDQSPTNSGGDTTHGARWVRLGNKSYNFIAQSGGSQIVIPVAHYYTWDDANGNEILDWNDNNSNGRFDYATEAATEDVYLVTIPGSGRNKGDYELHYYRFDDANNNNRIEDGELTEVFGAGIPSTIQPQVFDETGGLITDPDEVAFVVRQNFADWFSFYRRRILTAKAAVGASVSTLRGMELGVHTINRTFHEPLEYIADPNSTEMINYLSTIYSITPAGGTPLRRGLYEVGRYFQENNTNDFANLQTSEGLNQGTCSGDSSVFYDALDTDDLDTCDDSGGECQKAYVIALTDGYYNGGFNFPGGQDNKDGNSFEALKDGSSNSLADIAHFFYNTDLDTTLDNRCIPSGYDLQTQQHMVTYTVSFGVFGRFDPDLFPDCLPGGTPGQGGQPEIDIIGIEGWTDVGGRVVYDSGPGPFIDKCPDWHDNVSTNSPNSIDDLYHAAINGRGKFLNAADPEELVKQMGTIANLINDQRGTAASVAISTNEIEGDTLVYQTIYDSSDWSGDVLAKCIDNRGQLASCDRASCEEGCVNIYESTLAACTLGLVACEQAAVAAAEACLTTNACSSFQTCSEAYDTCIDTCSGNATCESICLNNKNQCTLPINTPPELKWSADVELDNKTVDYSLGTPVDQRSIITARADQTGVPFTWAGIDAAMKTALGGEQHLLEYLRGDNRYEAQNDSGNVHNYRDRSSRLGDFVNSEPVHYKSSLLGIDWLFVGANDGMLHVFDAQTGEEVFAYIPNAVFNKLPEIAAIGYDGNHKFFVDGYITIKDLGSSVVLIGGLGKGAKGYFALDITAAATNKTDIETHASDIVLWEYTDITQASVDPAIADNLGYSFSRPQLIAPSAGPEAHYLVFGNGYSSNNRRAVLFLVGLDDKGTILSTRMIDTNTGDATNCNGLSTPAIIFPQGDGIDDFIYAGDLLGNIWKFDVNDNNPSNWGIYFNDGTSDKPLFSAQSDAGYRQPITVQPRIISAPSDSDDGYLIIFGTGRMLDTTQDASDTSVQSVYGIWDWSKGWANLGYANPERTYHGAVQPTTTAVTSTCESTCDAELGDALTPATCEYLCAGSPDCIESCDSAHESCVTNCSSYRPVANVGNVLADASSAQYVGLLRQTQRYVAGINYNSDGTIKDQVYGTMDTDAYDSIQRAVSDNQIEWLNPAESTSFIADSSKTIKHVGWFYDLPANGERVVVEMQIIGSVLQFTTSIPSDSPCESGGSSQIWAVNARDGGATDTPFFDFNGDGIINSLDYIEIAPGIFIASSSFGVSGMANSGTFSILANSSSNEGVLFTTNEQGDDVEDTKTRGLGVSTQFWYDLDWQ